MDRKNLILKHKALIESLRGVNTRIAKKTGISRNWVSRVMNGYEENELIEIAALEEFNEIADKLQILKNATA